ncbi:hypothetical protein Goarm_017969, partial [Gossypium armourianum]|nr:hypothetical protein [Gossypium armourianum]
GNELDFNGNNQDYVSQDLNDRNHDEDKIKKDMNQESLLPFIGMKFQSLEEALGYYTKYTKQKGFGFASESSPTTITILLTFTVCHQDLGLNSYVGVIVKLPYPFLVDTIRVFYPSTKSNPNASRLVELIAIEGLI